MDRIIVACVVLLLCFHEGLTENENVEVEFLHRPDDGVMMVEEGSQLHLTCRVLNLAKGIEFMMANTVHWTHELVWNNVTKRTQVGTNANLNGDYKKMPDHYAMGFSAADDYVDLNFEIKKVRREDDGIFGCSTIVGTALNEITKSITVEIIVIKPVESMTLKFASYPAVTQSPEYPIEVDVGKTYYLGCNVEGSNPGVDELKVFLGGNELVNLTTPVSMPMTHSDFRQYTASTGGEITILTNHDNKVLMCEARGPNAVKKFIEMMLKVNTYDPTISCTEGEGYEGKMYVQVECSVNTTGIDVESTYFRLADVGHNLREGSNSYKDDNFKVETIKTNDDLFDIKMTIEKAKAWHFKERLLVVVESAGNHVTQQRLTINRIPDKTTTTPGPSNYKEDPNGGAAKGTVSVTMVFLSCILTVFTLIL